MRTVLFVSVRNSERLSNTIGRCIKNPALSQQLGQSGRKRALDFHDEKKVVDLQIDLIISFVNVER